MKQLKILLITPGLSPEMGGAAISEASLAGHLPRYCDVKVLCHRDRFDPKFAKRFGVKKVEFYRPIDVMLQSKPILDQIEHCDVVHLNGHWKVENYFFSKLCRKLKKPYVLHPRGMLWVGHRKIWLKKVFNLLLGNSIVGRAGRVIALSQFEIQQFSPYYLQKKRIAVIPNGIDSPKRTQEKRASNYFLYLGRIEHRKNLLFLIEAFQQYKKQGGSHCLRLVGPTERGYEAHVKKAIQSKGLQDSVFLEPPVYSEKKWSKITQAAALIYPSTQEPFGRVPFEALALGVPTLIPDESGSGEYLSNYLRKCIYRHEDLNSLVNAMRSISSDLNLEEGAQWVREFLSWDNITPKVVALYRQLCSDPGASQY